MLINYEKNLTGGPRVNKLLLPILKMLKIRRNILAEEHWNIGAKVFSARLAKLQPL